MFTSFHPWSYRPVPGTGGWGYDIDLEDTWQGLADAARRTLMLAKAEPGQIAGVAATSLRHGLILLDREGHPLVAVPNRDARAASEGMALADNYGDVLLQRAGRWPNPVFTVARMIWFAANSPDAWKKAAWVLSLNEWVAYRLCGVAASDPSQAGESLALDLRSREWAWDLIDEFGLPRNLFPPVKTAGTKLGGLTPAAAADFGLTPGTPVAVGGADTQCGLLGVGALTAGQLAAIAGTTTPVQLVVDRPLLDPQARLWTGLHVVPGQWVLESNAGGMGEALDWLATVLYPEAARPVVRLVAEAGNAPAGAAGILSSLGGQVLNGRNMTFPVATLTCTHFSVGGDSARRPHLARAALEGTAYALKANIEQVLSVAGCRPSTLLLGGGMTRGALWTQIVSDVLELPVEVAAAAEASALGAAICAGVGAGVYPSLEEGSRLLHGEVRRHTPDASRSATYRDLYSSWETLRASRAEADGMAAGVILQMMTSQVLDQAEKPATAFRPRILVTADLDEASLARLRCLGTVEYASYRENMRLLSGPDLVEALAGFQALVTEIDVVDADALQDLPDLRLVVACRGNAVNVDLGACTAFGVPVLHAPGRNADAVADLTLAFMLMLARKLPQASSFLRQAGGEAGDMARMGQAFAGLQGRELWRKTVGLIGLGAVGRGVAARLQGFGAHVLVYDPFVTPEQVVLAGAEPATLDVVLQESDIVSLHAAVTDQTRGLMNAEALACMKPGAWLINTARAALVDEEALLEALRLGRLGGAALDVFSVEPPPSDFPLLTLPNVIATPHIGGNTVEVSAHQGQIVVEDIERLLRGGRPRTVLNPETLAHFTWEGPRSQPSAEALASLKAGPAPAVRDLDQKAKSASPSTPAGPPAMPVGKPAGGLGKGIAMLKGLKGRITGKPAPEPETPPTGTPTTPAPLPAASGASGEQMTRLVRAFIAHATQDPKLLSFAAGPGLAMHFVLTDPSVEFHMIFRGGKIVGDLGAPAETPELRLKMKAEILDKMFTGQINPTKAAMTGKMSFSGDTRKAMGMQRIQGDLCRLYVRAREEVGGPGDLTAAALPAAPAVAAGAATAAAASAAAPAAQPSALVGDVRDELIQVIQELYATQLITATGGNISVRIPGTDQLWITPSALFKGDLRPQSMVRIDLEGQPLDVDSLSPSSERYMHCAVYRARAEVEAIIHAHAPYAIILANTNLPFLPISTEAAFLGDVGRVPFIMPGTKELAEAVAKALGKGSAVLMQNHGILVAASSLRRGADQAEVVERTSQVILGCYAVGKEPTVLPDDILETLRQVGGMMG
jgi:autoinducer 2 (AI-2) kinase